MGVEISYVILILGAIRKSILMFGATNELNTIWNNAPDLLLL